jgi:tetratricopeptide (TPR) repeat protein
MRTFSVLVVLVAVLPAAAQDRHHPDFGRALAEMRAGRWQKALEMWEDILRAKPLHHEARNNYAVCLIKVKRFKEAQTHLAYLVEAMPDKDGSRLNLGVARQGLKETVPALRDTDAVLEQRYKKARRSEYWEAEALFNCGWLSDELNQFEEAVEAYRAAVKRRPDYGKAWLGLAQALANLKRYKEARKALDEASGCSDTDPELRRLIADSRKPIEEGEKALPPETPPPAPPAPPAPAPAPAAAPTWTFWANGWLRTCGLWDRTAVGSIILYLFQHALLLVATNEGCKAHFRPPLTKQELETTVTWCFLLGAVLFGVSWGFAGCGKWVLLLLTAGVGAGIVHGANQ